MYTNAARATLSAASAAPTAMIQAVQKVVHELMKPEHAYELYQSLLHEKRERASV